MTKLLASVNSINEALIVLAEKVDIIDLKRPAAGALGALPLALIHDIVLTINKQCLISATIGDLPLQANTVFNAVKAMAETKVDYIKIGFFPHGDARAVIDKLSELTVKLNLIVVLFADTKIDIVLLKDLKQAGFSGVMLDTMNKSKGSLTQILSQTEIQIFVELAKANDLLCGLAGSLRLEDIAQLLPLQADYLGFRGALCYQHNRVSQLNKAAITQIRQVIN